MRIVDKKTFLEMPEGTVFARITEEWIVTEPLSINEQSLKELECLKTNQCKEMR